MSLFHAPAKISLAGSWSLAIGDPEPQFPQASLPDIPFQDSIILPGTTETRGKGPLNDARETHHLTRIRKFDGPVWYSREIEIPAAWKGKRIRLLLERTRFTQVWLDDVIAGSQFIEGTPQCFDLSALAAPGHHQLTVMVDNRRARRKLDTDVHQFSDNTQTNWNGIVGRLELLADDCVSIESVQAFPDVEDRSFHLEIHTENTLREAVEAELSVHTESWNHAGSSQRVAIDPMNVMLKPGIAEIVLELPLGEEARLWDEFHPNLYRIEVTLETDTTVVTQVINAGLREFSVMGTQIAVNGRITFLRGKHDGCVFPLTGHPPMDVEGWLHYFEICREYGMNHVRCHTWMPPGAAFEAADRTGIYFQPELPYWGTFDEKVRDVLMPEATAFLREYGNHASFAMFTLGNEIGGDRDLMNDMVVKLREMDSRHLYADGCNNVLWDPKPQSTNDFFITAKTRLDKNDAPSLPVRGGFCVFDGRDGVIQWAPGETRSDLSAGIEGIDLPVIGHETGQWCMYPDFREIEKYTGVVAARNLERFRDIVEKKGMLDQAHDFFKASGKLSALLYKEETELALRTPGFAGFQHLDLQDFPGQGTALVGILDAFMESKGLISAERWCEFTAPLVPLARFDRYTWTAGETFRADLELAHFGESDLVDASLYWKIESEDGHQLAGGSIRKKRLQQGGLRAIGSIETVLSNANVPGRFELVVWLDEGQGRAINRWPLWIYPETIDPSCPESVKIVSELDGNTLALLDQGQRVILIPENKNWADTIPGIFTSDYWNWPMFNGTPGTLGLLCNPGHPLLSRFPTQFHSERQWSEILRASTPVILSETAEKFRPIVQIIDNFERSEKLGLIFECRAGEGRLLVCASPLSQLADQPESRQLLHCLISYAASNAFDPQESIERSTLLRMLTPSVAQEKPIEASSFFQPPWGAVPVKEKAVDGDINARWIADSKDTAPWVKVDLEELVEVCMVELLWEVDKPGYRYLLEGSGDGKSWRELADCRDKSSIEQRHWIAVDASQPVRWIRLTVTETPVDCQKALRSLRVLKKINI